MGLALIHVDTLGASKEIIETQGDTWKTLLMITFLRISRLLAHHKHILNEVELCCQSLLHIQLQGLKAMAQMASFNTITNAEQAILVASVHVMVANSGAAITNLVCAQPGPSFLYLGSHNFDTVTF